MLVTYYIGLDHHKRTISYCVKEVCGRISDTVRVAALPSNLTT
jgi:hypothetical protein